MSAALLGAVANSPERPFWHWTCQETGRIVESMGLRDPPERVREWRW